MFTGIIEETGTLLSAAHGFDSCILRIRANVILPETKPGDSIAVNGVCLTATTVTPSFFTADVMPETLKRSNLGTILPGSRVNLERAMATNGRFGGHIVTGHIDGTGIISRIRRDDNAVWYTVDAAPAILRYIVEKGSVAMDGISLTVAQVTDRNFSVSVVPHTAGHTTLLDRSPGDRVNLENDCIGKYMEKLLCQPIAANAQPNHPIAANRHGAANAQLNRPSAITGDFLAIHGF